PTGNSFPRSAIEELAQQLAGVLLLDEAYAEFADDCMTQWAATTERVISLRTLSKAHGLAGLRIGYAVGPAQLIREIEKSRIPDAGDCIRVSIGPWSMMQKFLDALKSVISNL